MKKATRTVYECEHCGKLSYNAGAIHNHEERCKKNPANIPKCWECVAFDVGHFEPLEVHYTKEYEEEHPLFGNKTGNIITENRIMKVVDYRCRKKGCKLYSILTSKKKIADLEKNGVIKMPSLVDGCDDFVEIKYPRGSVFDLPWEDEK